MTPPTAHTRYRRALHIFRRDLRLTDNTALNAAIASAQEVVPCFIFNDVQVGEHRYRSVNGLAFMIESLEELSDAIAEEGGELLLLHGDPIAVCRELIETLGVDAIFVNKDYTPFSKARDEALAQLCAERGVAWHSHFDLLLTDPEAFCKDDGQPYTVFTPFFKRASKLTVPAPQPTARAAHGSPFATGLMKHRRVDARRFWPNESAKDRVSHGGRRAAHAILDSLSNFKAYETQRNLPAVRGTTLLAPHNKFGTVSIREVYRAMSMALGPQHGLIREVYWRDFFTHIAWHFPHVFGHAFHRMYDSIPWSDDSDAFQRWCAGETGFPIVDAGMRELVATGFMHNRVRMITASFLVKDLHISWQRGEEFFARHLTDYDPCVNNGSWQWSASTGCDAQPYFRIFNPWLQQQRFDPDCVYIKRWVPELAKLSKGTIHNLSEETLLRPPSYPAAMVDHAHEKIIAETTFRECREQAASATRRDT